jgi:ribosome-binding factor A
MSTIRQEQVQNRLVEEISGMLQRDLKDPRLGFITVTGADITRDLRHAKVYVSVLGDQEQQDEALAALRRAAGFIRGEFTRRAHLRVAPELTFHMDEAIDRGARIFELLHQIEQSPKAQDPAPSETE